MTLLSLTMTPNNSQVRVVLTPYIIQLWEAPQEVRGCVSPSSESDTLVPKPNKGIPGRGGGEYSIARMFSASLILGRIIILSLELVRHVFRSPSG